MPSSWSSPTAHSSGPGGAVDPISSLSARILSILLLASGAAVAIVSLVQWGRFAAAFFADVGVFTMKQYEAI